MMRTYWHSHKWSPEGFCACGKRQCTQEVRIANESFRPRRCCNAATDGIGMSGLFDITKCSRHCWVTFEIEIED